MNTEGQGYIRIFATSFLIEDERHSIEYRVIFNSYGCSLNQRIHGGTGFFDFLTEWIELSQFSNLHDAIIEIFDRLRSMEIQNGLYKELLETTMPIELYSEKADQWVYYITRLNYIFFSICGNNVKYLPRPSQKTKEFYLRIYEGLKSEWRTPDVSDLSFGELIKREISIFNQREFCLGNFGEGSHPEFLKKYYHDFEDQIDRYMLHFKPEERGTIITGQNVKDVQYKFEHFLLPEK